MEGNALDTLYDAQADKVATATLGTLKDGDKTGPAVKVIKLLAQSTGDFTREELKKDVKLAWTDKTKAEIAAAKGENAGTTNGGGSSNTNGTNPTNPTNGGGTNTGGGTGTVTPSNGDNTGGGNTGGDDNGGDGGDPGDVN